GLDMTSPPGPGGRVRAVAEFEGKLYAATESGFYGFDGAWKKLRALNYSMEWVGVIDGKLHAANGYQIFRLDPSGWRKILQRPENINWRFNIRNIQKIDGTLYLGGDNAGALIAVEGDEWKPLLSGYDVNGISKAGGRVLAATATGVYEVIEGKKAKRFG